MYYVELKHIPNPDIEGCGYHWGYIPEENNLQSKCKTLEEASKICRDFITRLGLGSGNWTGGKVFNKSGNQVALICYNGKIININTPDKNVAKRESKKIKIVHLLKSLQNRGNYDKAYQGYSYKGVCDCGELIYYPRDKYQCHNCLVTLHWIEPNETCHCGFKDEQKR